MMSSLLGQIQINSLEIIIKIHKLQTRALTLGTYWGV